MSADELVENLTDTLGVLLQTGMTIDIILDMSMSQISFCSQAVFKQKVKMLEMVFEPIASAFGGKKKKKPAKPDKNLTPEQKAVQRDTKLMWELQKAGIRISPK